MKTKVVSFLLGCAWLCVAGFASAQSSSANSTPNSLSVIRAGNLIDPTSGQTKHNQVIVVRGNRIESMGDAGSASVPSGANVIDLSTSTLLPGMIDSHTTCFCKAKTLRSADTTFSY